MKNFFMGWIWDNKWLVLARSKTLITIPNQLPAQKKGTLSFKTRCRAHCADVAHYVESSDSLLFYRILNTCGPRRHAGLVAGLSAYAEKRCYCVLQM